MGIPASGSSYPPYPTHGMTATHDFIDDSLVGMEIEGQARVALQRRSVQGHLGDRPRLTIFRSGHGKPSWWF